MRLLAGARYRHKNCLDVDLDIIKVNYRGPDYTRVNVAYINRNWEGGEFLIITEKNVKIPAKCIEMLERVK